MAIVLFSGTHRFLHTLFSQSLKTLIFKTFTHQLICVFESLQIKIFTSEYLNYLIHFPVSTHYTRSTKLPTALNNNLVFKILPYLFSKNVGEETQLSTPSLPVEGPQAKGHNSRADKFLGKSSKCKRLINCSTCKIKS